MDLIYHNGNSDITLNQIYTFIVVAEYGNFTKASAELHISQPSISKIISKLEEVTGLTVFIRNPRGAMLTPAGRILYQEWKKALDVTQSGFEKACSVLNDNRSIRIGLLRSYSATSQIQPLIQEFEMTYPDIEIFLDEADSFDLRRGIANDKYDVIFTPSYEKAYYDKEGYLSRLFSAAPIDLCISKHHPAANSEEFNVKLLQHDKIYTLNNEYAPDYEELVKSISQRYKLSSLAVTPKSNLQTVYNAMIKGEGCFLYCSSWFPAIDADIFCRYHMSNEMGGIMMVWNKTTTNPSVANLRKCIRF